MRFFRHLIEAVLNPFFLFIIAYIVLLFFLYRARQPKLFLGFLSLLLMLMVLSTGWMPQALSYHLENQYPVIQHPDQSIHWIVVFSGGQADGVDKPDNMVLYSASIKRLVEAVRLYRLLPESKLVLSGGGLENESTEAQRLMSLTKWFGVPDNDVILEDKGLNTVGEAVEIKKMLGTQPFYLVTSASHMPRSMWLCLSQGLKPIAAPTDFTLFWKDERWEKTYLPNPHNLVYLSIALHEVLGMGWAKMTGSVSRNV